MKEKEYFASMIKERIIDDARIKAKACAPIPHRGFEWRRAAAIATLSLAVLIGTAFAIPSARAEILSWFHVSTPQDYLATDKDTRTEIPELDSLITSPEPENGFVLIPIDRTDSKAVNSEGALKMSKFFYENSDISLGDAMFDGQYFYQTVHMNGLSGLYLLEDYTGGWQTGVQVDPYAVWGLYENGPGEEYLTGKWTLYERPFGRVLYELEDGTRFGGSFDLGTSIDPYMDMLIERGLFGEDSPIDAQEQIDAMNRKYLEQSGLNAVASIWAPEEVDLAGYADEDGNLKVKVFYEVEVCEEERGDGSFVPATELFKAQLGTITVNVRAYQDLKTSEFVAANGAVVWGADTLTLSRVDIDFGKSDDGYADDRISFSKQRVSTEGLSMNVEDIKMDALGIRDLMLRVSAPESWTKEEREAFAASLEIGVLLNGERGDWYWNGTNCDVQEDGSILFRSMVLEEVPYDMLESIREISFVPKFRASESIEYYDANDSLLGILNPAYGEVVWSDPGVHGWDDDSTVTEFPQYAIVLKLK